jgi:hypothetical protein
VGRKELAEASLDWMFIDSIPLLYDKRKIVRQTKVEEWLDLAQVVRELGLERNNENRRDSGLAEYVV